MIKTTINHSSTDATIQGYILDKFNNSEGYERLVVENYFKKMKEKDERIAELVDELEERNAVNPKPLPIHHNSGDDHIYKHILTNVQCNNDYDRSIITDHMEKWKEGHDQRDAFSVENDSLDDENENLKNKIEKLKGSLHHMKERLRWLGQR